MKKHLLYFVIIITFSFSLFAQPDSRFRAFDWTLYRGAGAINSISEGYTYAYIGTESGGLKRFNVFGQVFDDPITTAQGLKENNVTAVHFDRQTGNIWVATPNHIQYSFSREGDWYPIELIFLGLSKYDRISQIGSSANYIWLKARSSFIKIEHTSGILVGIFPMPDELNIIWSSEPYRGQTELKEIFMNYSVMDGWLLNGDQFIDDLGRNVEIKTGLVGRHGNVWVGAEDGTFFHATTTMEAFYPLETGVANTDVSALHSDGEYLWLGSHDYVSSKGITRLNPRTNESYLYEFDGIINMMPSPIFSINVSEGELWAGGDGVILYHDFKENYWRTLDQTRGVPNGKLWDIYSDSTYIWLSSSSGIRRIERVTQRESPIGIEHLFDRIPVYDLESARNEIWIGSRSGVFVFDIENPQIRQAIDLGRKDFPELITRVTALDEFDHVIYVVGEMGIAKFDFDIRSWELIFPSTVYHAKTIYSMVVEKNHLFLGSSEGLIRINLNTGFMREYLFGFIGQVNDIVVDGKLVWLGTSNGLVKFKWKRDL
jgi:ligand-binding sensor domain-containing protein